MSYGCTRPKWSNESNDYCPCDCKELYEAALEFGDSPCLACTYWGDYYD